MIVAPNLLHGVDDVIGEEHMMFFEGLVVAYEHQPKPTQLLHVFGIVVEVFLPKYLERAVDPRILLL